MDYEKLHKCEQKPTDKVEPKFYEGDWIVYKNDICQIVKREEGCNKLVTVFGIEKELVNERNLSTARLWTIKDVKDGNILCSGQLIVIFKQWEDNTDYTFIIAHAGIDVSGKLQITDGHWLISNDATLATKEQRDLLFQKLKEAGYEWNADYKELRKIEQNDAWNKEDEKFFQTALWHISNSISNGKSTNISCSTTDWLKSLKGRILGSSS